ncbi:MAG: tRNA (adenosine(37)-N6)-threonylcarbamoyltransferase complex transferase subunit TsaD [Burkholderiales bacterium]|nr:tRNA (adenosine(37)-N6)-threonylcarbamoyltransferase complex transferase subunit TsaD [Burkholderiales bacterium]
MLILGIESSCDETGVALYDSATRQLTHRLHSQVEMHAAYGGVVPELASRDHIRRLIPLIEAVINESPRSLHEIDAIAVTQGPGLGGALLVGASVAAGLGAALGKPVIGIHHLEGHLLSPLLSEPRPDFPFVALLVSGGHTQLMAVEGIGRYKLLGETVDDAAGEAFDKTASLLGLSYPGGPALSKLAENGNPARFKLPRPMIGSGDLDFSFSGLKTAALTLTRKLEAASALDSQSRADIAVAFQSAIVEVLVTKSLSALTSSGMTQLVVAGGVGANKSLRERLTQEAARRGASVCYPPMELCTDNGAMIAFAAAMRLSEHPTLLENSDTSFNIKPRWPLEEVSST